MSRVEMSAVQYEVHGHVATVWLHRPHRHNAWTGRMHADYRTALAALDADPAVRVVVVTGTPPAFCVGGDSEALQGHADRGGYDPGLAADAARPGYGVRAEFDADFAFQFALRFPIIAAVNGAAAGVGLALALFCDLRFGAANAKLTTAAPKLGLPAEYGMSWILPRLVGATWAADLLLSGRVITPGGTEGWGLWNGVEPDGETTLTRALEYAEHLATGVGPTALATTKRQLYSDLLHHSPADAIHEAQRVLAVAMGTEEYREGVAALRDQRAPRFG
jgi:enoyl-CoA hydratase/carnithine racemase